MTHRYCKACHDFYKTDQDGCPRCGDAPRTNTALLSSRWQSALNDKATRALREG